MHSVTLRKPAATSLSTSATDFRFNDALRPQKSYGLLGTGKGVRIRNESPGPPPCSHGSELCDRGWFSDTLLRPQKPFAS